MSVKLKNGIVEVYSTDIKSQQEEAFLLDVLQTKFPNYKINFDLEDCDNILRVETQDASLDVDGIKEAIKNFGFAAEVLPDEPNTHNVEKKY